MEILKDTWEVASKYKRVVVALGNFDGVHIGHQRLIRKMVDYAHDKGAAAVVFTFHPHPLQVLFPDKAPRLLISPERKIKLISRLGVDALLMTPFTRELAQMSPESFIEDVLCKQLRNEAVFVGFNFTFGHRGAGTPSLLQKFGEKLGFQVQVLPPIKLGETIISSSEVRRALEEGNIGKAQSYLGYYPVLEGRVVLGDRRGQKIGFPTANLDIGTNVLTPARGVYVARVKVRDEIYDGVVNIGVKPTFGQNLTTTIEVHILEFTQVIYGECIEISLLDRIRNEKRFSSVTELVSQIERDIEVARMMKNNSLLKQG